MTQASFCAPSCGLSVLRYAGVKRPPRNVDEVAKGMHTTADGTDPLDIARYLNRFKGLRCQIHRKMTWETIQQNVRAGRVSMVCFEAWPDPGYPQIRDSRGKLGPDWANIDSGHYSLVVAADDQGVWLMDPWLDKASSGVAPRGYLPKDEFLLRFLNVDEHGNSVGSGDGLTISFEPPHPQGPKRHIQAARFIG